ncbi:hypothetical protein DLAC_03046 [Tieghemostelium lacteum]|uniref:Ankyrin repeat-containing protein n=1 Tax=Tieghemostelium lacteum TaxID=361077 RepID=A0A152A257_TIELA|nr:hypothetical protein DLAC_03046 [Tieghemostelium lacteum]|eukprot:KYR00306.1 hypothetical protein DLAC_03046 [Tieghemostelium lacteum]
MINYGHLSLLKYKLEKKCHLSLFNPLLLLEKVKDKEIYQLLLDGYSHLLNDHQILEMSIQQENSIAFKVLLNSLQYKSNSFIVDQAIRNGDVGVLEFIRAHYAIHQIAFKYSESDLLLNAITSDNRNQVLEYLIDRLSIDFTKTDFTQFTIKDYHYSYFLSLDLKWIEMFYIYFDLDKLVTSLQNLIFDMEHYNYSPRIFNVKSIILNSNDIINFIEKLHFIYSKNNKTKKFLSPSFITQFQNYKNKNNNNNNNETVLELFIDQVLVQLYTADQYRIYMIIYLICYDITNKKMLKSIETETYLDNDYKNYYQHDEPYYFQQNVIFWIVDNHVSNVKRFFENLLILYNDGLVVWDEMEILCEIIKRNENEIFKLLVSKQQLQSQLDQVLKYIVKDDKLDYLMILSQCGHLHKQHVTLIKDYSLEFGKLKIYQFLVDLMQYNPKSPNQYDLKIACASGHNDIVRYLLEVVHEDCTPICLIRAAENRNLPLLKYLIQSQPHIHCDRLIHECSKSVDLLELLKSFEHGWALGRFGSPSDAVANNILVNENLQKGYIHDFFSFLKSADEITSPNYMTIGKNGDIALIENLISNFKLSDNQLQFIFKSSIESGHFHVIQYFHKSGILPYKSNVSFYKGCIYSALTSRHLPIIKHLLEQLKIPLPNATELSPYILSLMTGGYLSIIKYLIDRYNEKNIIQKFLPIYLEGSIKNKKIPMMNYLLDTGSYTSTFQLLQSPILTNNPDVLYHFINNSFVSNLLNNRNNLNK